MKTAWKETSWNYRISEERNVRQIERNKPMNTSYSEKSLENKEKNPSAFT